ncbi:MAG: cytochrome ubiquinol oxidase subunit I, partial [Planctomycetota bacterium]
MDAVFLARLQFAITIGFHFLFPPITIGLAWLLVVIERKAWKTGDPDWERAGRFFAKILGLTFAVGVATGIVMEFQFGTNWAEYSKVVGDIFGAPLAAEGVFAFFLESGFLGLYLFGRSRVGRPLHWFAILMVAVGSTLSAFWIIVANSWQQTPTGFIVANGRAELLDFWAAVFNPSTIHRYTHTVMAALTSGAFFMAGISAWMLLKGKHVEIAKKTLTVAVIFGLIFSIASAFPTGHHHAKQVAETQPTKFAAIEGLYETQDGAPKASQESRFGISIGAFNSGGRSVGTP